MSLVLEQVSYTYSSHEGKVCALKDVSFEIEAGQLLGIIGHTGSGKSTLLQIIAGLILPTSGRVLIDGKDTRDKSVRANLFKELGIAFQYPEHQFFAPTVAKEVSFTLVNAGVATHEAEARSKEALDMLGLDYERYKDLSPFELSGGEMRRVALASVMAAGPKYLILDEPTSGLDPQGRQELGSIVENYHKLGNTLVLVSHNMDNIARLSDKIAVIKDGSLVLFGSPAEVFAYPKELRAMNLGLPEAAGFAADLKSMGLPLSSGLLTIDALADAIYAAVSKNSGNKNHSDANEVKHGL